MKKNKLQEKFPHLETTLKNIEIQGRLFPWALEKQNTIFCTDRWDSAGVIKKTRKYNWQ